MPPLHYVRRARSPRAILSMAAVYILLAGLALGFDAVWWLVALIWIFTLPALVDLLTDARAGLSIEGGRLGWFSGRRSATVSLAEIDRVRLDTRWDFSVRATLFLKNNQKLRIPAECLPHKALESHLTARGLPVERHHFTVF